MPRPYRIPIPDWAAILVVIPPTIGISFIFATSNWYVYVFCAIALFLGTSLFKLSKISKNRGWCAYKSKENYSEYDKTPLDSSDADSKEPMTTTEQKDREWEYDENESPLFEIGEIS